MGPLNAKTAFRRFPRTKPDVPSQGLITAITLKENSGAINPIARISQISLYFNLAVIVSRSVIRTLRVTAPYLRHVKQTSIANNSKPATNPADAGRMDTNTTCTITAATKAACKATS